MVNQSIVTNIATGIKNLITNEISNHANTTANSSTKGHVQSATNPPQDISNTSAIGTDNGCYARADHVHKASFDDLADVPSSFTPASHSHGNLKNDGTISSNYSTTCSYFAGFDSNNKLYKCNKLYSTKIVNSSALSNIGSDSSATQSTINSKINTALGNKANTSHTHSSSNITDLVDAIYPIGSIYMSINSTDPSELFGGSWVQLTNTFLYASTTSDVDATTATAGSANAVVVSHNHGTASGYRFMEAHQGLEGGDMGAMSGSGRHYTYQTTRSDGAYWNTSYTTANAGENGSGKNMPPYMKVYMWKRTS